MYRYFESKEMITSGSISKSLTFLLEKMKISNCFFIKNIFKHIMGKAMNTGVSALSLLTSTSFQVLINRKFQCIL